MAVDGPLKEMVARVAAHPGMYTLYTPREFLAYFNGAIDGARQGAPDRPDPRAGLAKWIAAKFDTPPNHVWVLTVVRHCGNDLEGIRRFAALFAEFAERP
jgi:hypothetical protein